MEDIRDILIFGLILEGDIFANGLGTTREDEELYQQALKKYYEVDENADEETVKQINEKILADIKDMLDGYRDLVRKYIEG